MKKNKTLLIFLILCSFLFSQVSVVLAAADLPKKPLENKYVFDYANLIEDTKETELQNIGQQIEKASGAEIVLVTIESLKGYDLESYANELFRDWGLGDKSKNNGVLILVNKENMLTGEKGRIRIEVGYGLEGALTDITSGYILDTYVLENWNQDNYEKGIIEGYKAVSKVVADEYELQLKNTNLDSYQTNEPSNLSDLAQKLGIPLPLLYLILAIIGFSVLSLFIKYPELLIILLSSGGRRGGGGGGFGGGGGGFGGFGGGSSGGGGASR